MGIGNERWPPAAAAFTMPEKISKIFGQAVRLRRHVLSLSQEELAWRGGLNLEEQWEVAILNDDRTAGRRAIQTLGEATH